MSSPVFVDNKKKDNLIIGKGPTQGLDDTKLTAEVFYLFCTVRKRICIKSTL